MPGCVMPGWIEPGDPGRTGRAPRSRPEGWALSAQLEHDRQFVAVPGAGPAMCHRVPTRAGRACRVVAVGVLRGAPVASLVRPDDRLLRLHDLRLPRPIGPTLSLPSRPRPARRRAGPQVHDRPRPGWPAGPHDRAPGMAGGSARPGPGDGRRVRTTGPRGWPAGPPPGPRGWPAGPHDRARGWPAGPAANQPLSHLIEVARPLGASSLVPVASTAGPGRIWLCKQSTFWKLTT